MNIRKYIDKPCSMLTINELDSKLLSSSDIVCNTIIKNTKSINSTVFTPPLSLIDSKDFNKTISDAKHHTSVESDSSNNQVSSAVSMPRNQAYSDSACSRPLLIPRSKIHLINDLTGKGGAKIKTANGHIITSTDSGNFAIGKENIPVDIMEDEDLMHSILGLGPIC